MKWDFELSQQQNESRWRQADARRKIDVPTTGEEFTPEAHTHHRLLNQALIEVERRVGKDIRDLRQTLGARVADPDDWLDAYEIELEVAFVLRDDDPESDDDDDNVLCIRRHQVSERTRDPEWDIGGPHDYDWESHAGTLATQHREAHCWLYHDLYDHSGVGWQDICRVGRLWVDLKVTYQQQIRSLDDAE